MSFFDQSDDISLASVDPNPSNEQFFGDSDGGADDFSSAVNAVGSWGSEIASVITGHAVSVVQTPTGPRPIGAAGSSIAKTGSQQTLVIAVLVIGVVAVIYTVQRRK
jgi:hypothetical protein